ncbi:hypothetical protein GCM10010512_38340 [Streptomyces thermoviolaceus subsp. thermoviolaceus]|nr:hypothetical protein GCM10010499_35600 [Streptomyces thermoviolaceus subsp. apingens]GHB03257.1 hypothetical protein GCM10010512_38340 [Streptomyces thermoviolaceus subsp. thermoviolaceus]
MTEIVDDRDGGHVVVGQGADDLLERGVPPDADDTVGHEVSDRSVLQHGLLLRSRGRSGVPSGSAHRTPGHSSSVTVARTRRLGAAVPPRPPFVPAVRDVGPNPGRARDVPGIARRDVRPAVRAHP